jgi:hypothetical protein
MKADGRYVDSGTVEADSERQAIDMVFIEQADKVDAETSYNIEVGDSRGSSYGDEFLRSAGASSLDDTKVTAGGHSFDPMDLERKDPAKILADHGLGKCKQKFDNTGFGPRQPMGGSITPIVQELEFGTSDEYNVGDMIIANGEQFIITEVNRSLDGASSSVNARRAKDFGSSRVYEDPDVLKKFVDSTPVDTGKAREGWRKFVEESRSPMEHMRKVIDGAPGWKIPDGSATDCDRDGHDWVEHATLQNPNGGRVCVVCGAHAWGTLKDGSITGRMSHAPAAEPPVEWFFDTKPESISASPDGTGEIQYVKENDGRKPASFRGEWLTEPDLDGL